MTPELMSMREALNEAIADKERLSADRNSSIAAQVKYDIALTRWARMSNHYDDMLRQALSA